MSSLANTAVLILGVWLCFQGEFTLGAIMTFQGDIFSNIVIFAPQLTLDEAWEAAELAGIADDIRAMPTMN
jgi:ABC-type bacteriocin/lantibiotic exporter with double-glycine peptidase domain